MVNFSSGTKDQLFTEAIANVIQHEIISAAEPVIQQAIKDTEIALRKKVAEIAVVHAQSFFQVHTHRDVMEIRIGLNGVALNEITR
jgi:hypothetical protein